MNIEIFINGCSTCGNNALYIARVKSVYPNATVYNTRYDSSEKLEQHIEYMKQAGMQINSYTAIVVENNGERIVELKSWSK